MADASFRPDPALYPFESRWMDLRAADVSRRVGRTEGSGGRRNAAGEPDSPSASVARLHYIDEGDPSARPILFLHGNPTWSFLYRRIVRLLRGRYRCVAVDYPGFGLSEPPPGYGHSPAEHARVVRALVRHLDLEGLTIVGQDWGGPIGLRVALDERERIAGLVFGNTWYGRLRAWHLRLFARVMASAPARWAVLRRNAFVEWLMPLATDRPLPDGVMDHYRAVLPTPDSRRGVAEFPRQLLASGDWLEENARAVPDRLSHVPVLLAWGVHDFAFRPSFMTRFRRDFADLETVRLDANHYIQEDAPDALARAVDRFLSGRRERREV